MGSLFKITMRAINREFPWNTGVKIRVEKYITIVGKWLVNLVSLLLYKCLAEIDAILYLVKCRIIAVTSVLQEQRGLHNGTSNISTKPFRHTSLHSHAFLTSGCRDWKRPLIVNVPTSCDGSRRASSSGSLCDSTRGFFTSRLPASWINASIAGAMKTNRQRPGWAKGKDNDCATNMPITIDIWFEMPKDLFIIGGAICAMKTGTVTVDRPQPMPTRTLST